MNKFEIHYPFRHDHNIKPLFSRHHRSASTATSGGPYLMPNKVVFQNITTTARPELKTTTKKHYEPAVTTTLPKQDISRVELTPSHIIMNPLGQTPQVNDYATSAQVVTPSSPLVFTTLSITTPTITTPAPPVPPAPRPTSQITSKSYEYRPISKDTRVEPEATHTLSESHLNYETLDLQKVFAAPSTTAKTPKRFYYPYNKPYTTKTIPHSAPKSVEEPPVDLRQTEIRPVIDVAPQKPVTAYNSKPAATAPVMPPSKIMRIYQTFGTPSVDVAPSSYLYQQVQQQPQPFIQSPSYQNNQQYSQQYQQQQQPYAASNIDLGYLNQIRATVRKIHVFCLLKKKRSSVRLFDWFISKKFITF